MANEYDAAQDRGEVRKKGGDYTSKASKVPSENLARTAEDIGLTRKQIHKPAKFAMLTGRSQN